MKKLIFGIVITVLTMFDANAQRPSLSSSLCEVGEHPVLSYEFKTIRFHRASTTCKRRFSICSDGYWSIECV